MLTAATTLCRWYQRFNAHLFGNRIAVFQGGVWLAATAHWRDAAAEVRGQEGGALRPWPPPNWLRRVNPGVYLRGRGRGTSHSAGFRRWRPAPHSPAAASSPGSYRMRAWLRRDVLETVRSSPSHPELSPQFDEVRIVCACRNGEAQRSALCRSTVREMSPNTVAIPRARAARRRLARPRGNQEYASDGADRWGGRGRGRSERPPAPGQPITCWTGSICPCGFSTLPKRLAAGRAKARQIGGAVFSSPRRLNTSAGDCGTVRCSGILI